MFKPAVHIAAALAGLVLAAGAAAPARAEVLVFTAELSGHTPSTDTGSNATGHARILVDTEARTVDVDLSVDGIIMEELWGRLAHAPIGPIHLHRYGGHDHSASNNSALVFPLPMGPSYAETPKGFRVRVKHFAYADAAALLKSDVTFEAFVMSMEHGEIVLNIHTNQDQDGEISGEVVPQRGPGGGGHRLMLSAQATPERVGECLALAQLAIDAAGADGRPVDPFWPRLRTALKAVTEGYDAETAKRAWDAGLALAGHGQPPVAAREHGCHALVMG